MDKYKKLIKEMRAVLKTMNKAKFSVTVKANGTLQFLKIIRIWEEQKVINQMDHVV